MIKFLAIQHTYHGVEAALFERSKLLGKKYDDKKRASKNFITMLNSLFVENGCELADLSFIAANRGPGPFTTLRVVLASVNGLGFATKKPLIGIDGLAAILEEYHAKKTRVTVALLDAFSGDVYFGIEREDQDRYIGYKNISLLLNEIQQSYPDINITFIGNGVIKYKDLILSVFKKYAKFPDPLPQHCSVEQIGITALDHWKKSEGLTDQLLPMYLKQMAFAKPEKPSSF